MKHRLVSVLAVAIAFAAVPATHDAQASAVWGATEWTQIANNIELVMQYKEMVEQTITQVRQYETQLKMLRQMDGAKLDSMLMGVAGVRSGTEVLRALAESQEVHEALTSLNENMGALAGEGLAAVEIAKILQGRGHDISPNDYVGMIRVVAQDQDNAYAHRLATINSSLTDAQHDIERVNRIAATSKNIQTHVEGFGALVQTNAIMSSQLSGLRQTMSAAAAMNVETARLLTKQDAEQVEAQQRHKDFVNTMILPAGGQ